VTKAALRRHLTGLAEAAWQASGSNFTRFVPCRHSRATGATILRTAVRVPDDGGDARRTTVAGVDGERIRRKPVLDGLVNEYTPAAQRAEDPAGHRPDPGVVRNTGYLV